MCSMATDLPQKTNVLYTVWLNGNGLSSTTSQRRTGEKRGPCYMYTVQVPAGVMRLTTTRDRHCYALPWRQNRSVCMFVISIAKFVTRQRCLSTLHERRDSQQAPPFSPGQNTSISASPIPIGPAVRTLFAKKAKNEDCDNRHVPSTTDRFLIGTIIFPRQYVRSDVNIPVRAKYINPRLTGVSAERH